MADVNGIPYVEPGDLVSGYPAVSQTLAQEVSDQLASKLPYEYSDSEPTTSTDGFLWFDDNDTPPTPKFWDGAAFQALTSGKILQIVRETDSTERSTSSTSFVDVTGMSVTITPQKSDSALLIICAFSGRANRSSGSGATARYAITDNSNNAISGAEDSFNFQAGNGNTSSLQQVPVLLIAYATPATTSAVTYTLRHRIGSSGDDSTIKNNESTGQLYAIEVSA